MIACALQKEWISGKKIPPSLVFEYLNQLRVMGTNQSFRMLE